MKAGVLLAVSLGAGCVEDPLVTAWHRPFRLTEARSAVETGGACEPEQIDGGLVDAGFDQRYGFLAVSVGVPDLASLYLCRGPEDCPSTPIGSIWIREWTKTRLSGETGVDSVFGDLCTLAWNGIDATRTDGGEIHVELREAHREETVELEADCDEALEGLIRSSCDSVLVLDGTQE